MYVNISGKFETHQNAQLMPSSRMSRNADLVRTDASEEHSASIFRVIRFDRIETLAIADDGGATFLRNVSSYMSHTA
jgi:hypothetical protein